MSGVKKRKEETLFFFRSFASFSGFLSPFLGLCFSVFFPVSWMFVFALRARACNSEVFEEALSLKVLFFLFHFFSLRFTGALIIIPCLARITFSDAIFVSLTQR